MLLRIAYCDDEIENGKKIKDYINQLMRIILTGMTAL